MTFDLSLSPCGVYAVLTNREDVTLARVVERQRAMRAFAAERCVTRFLLDSRGHRYLEGPLSLYKFAREILPEEGFDYRWKVALVATPGDYSHDFVETACRNAGQTVTVFKDYGEAEAWLSGRC